MALSELHVDPNSRGQRASRSPDEVIAGLAWQQSGIVGRRQLVARGIPLRSIDYRVKVGRLLVVHRGVYAVGHAALPPRGLLVAGLLVAGAGSALSHRTAAHLWKLTSSMPPSVEITTTDRSPRQRPGLVFHHTTDLDAYIRDGLPLTTPIRTLLDLAATRSCAELERATSEALVLKLIAFEALSTQRGAGSAILARIAGAGIAPTRSELERRFLTVVSRFELPRPQVNARIGPYTVDFLWPGQDLVVEVDGDRFHGHPIAIRRDHARDAELQLRGYAVLRFTWPEVVHDPAMVAARVAGMLNRPATREAS